MKRSVTIFIFCLSLAASMNSFAQDGGNSSGTPSENKTKPAEQKTALGADGFDWLAPANSQEETSTGIVIGNQTWMGENLNVSTFRNGDPIMEAKTDAEWIKAFEDESPAWCYYNNDPAMGAKYGKLYNWYAVFDSRELAPHGWHISTKEDWINLNTTLNGGCGKKIKSLNEWKDGGPNYISNNSYNFSALPGGYRLPLPDSFEGIGSSVWWWTSTQTRITGFDMGNGYKLDYDDNEIRGITPENEGLYVRCVED